MLIYTNKYLYTPHPYPTLYYIGGGRTVTVIDVLLIESELIGLFLREPVKSK